MTESKGGRFAVEAIYKYIYRNVKNLILESKSALQSWSFINNYIGKEKEKLKHRTTELFRKGLVVLSHQVHKTLTN